LGWTEGKPPEEDELAEEVPAVIFKPGEKAE
jgi:hypothetical protein